MTTYFLVNCKETDVRLFHGEEEHERTAAVANAGCAATAVHEGAVNAGWEHGHVTPPGGARAWSCHTPQLRPTLPLTSAELEELAVTCTLQTRQDSVSQLMN